MIDPLTKAANPNELQFDIPFTQYLLPDGRTRRATFSVIGKTAVDAKAVLDKGLRFECEILTTSEVSLTVFDPETEEDIAIEIVANGPGVPDAVDRLVESAVSYERKE